MAPPERQQQWVPSGQSGHGLKRSEAVSEAAMASPEKQQLWVLSGYRYNKRARLGGSNGLTIGITVMVTLMHFADELSHSQIKFPFGRSAALYLTV